MATEQFRSVGYPIRIHGGTGVLSRLGEEVGRARGKRAFVVCGQTVAHRTDLPGRVKDALGDRFAGVFDGVQAGSPLPSVELGVAAASDAGADTIIALGGGSAVVTARAIVILLAEGGHAQDHATKYPPGRPPVSPRLMQPKIPNIVVLTTPTTAARAGTAVIDPETGHRLEMFDPKTRPYALFWDTEALLTASPSLCVSAGASCFSGVVGALQSERPPSPLAEGDLLQSLRLMREDLPRVASGGPDGQARLNLCAAAYLSNRASDSGPGGRGLGVVGALAHSLDTRYPECSHGAAYSILTAPGMRFNAESNASGQARLASILGVATNGDDRESAGSAASWVEETYAALGMPSRLREVGVPQEGIEELAVDSMTDFAITRNVRPVSGPGELEALLRSIW